MNTKLSDVPYDIEPQVGSYVELDNGVRTLLHYDDAQWELCEFRIPGGSGLYQFAVNVEVTGYTLQRLHSYEHPYVRIKVTYVADPMDVDIYTGERQSEDVILGGWMAVTEREMVWNREKQERIDVELMRRQVEREAEEAFHKAQREVEEAWARAQRAQELIDAAQRELEAERLQHRAAHLEL